MKRILALMILLAFTDLVLQVYVSYAATKGNIRYEVEDDRVVVSCVDNQNPILRTVPRPRGGYYAVVVCEGNQK